MPATEETYRRQPTLHLVFAISSIAMLLATVWMVMADHLRPWKQVQREFQLIEREKLNASEKEKQDELNTKYKSQLDQIDAENRSGQCQCRGTAEPDSPGGATNQHAGCGGRRPGHEEAVQEDRARQHAQSLRRDDRSRRGARARGFIFRRTWRRTSSSSRIFRGSSRRRRQSSRASGTSGTSCWGTSASWKRRANG